MGSMEQHGPHLPLNTDTVLAEAFTRRIVERWGEAYDLWQLPPLPVGLSREHAWAAGTMSLSVSGMTALLRDLGREIARALPARNLLIVNGHGGNRGILEALGRELRGDFGLNLVRAASRRDDQPGGGRGRAGNPCRQGRDLGDARARARSGAPRTRSATSKRRRMATRCARLILDPAASWPWRAATSASPITGVIGDARLGVGGARPRHRGARGRGAPARC